MAAAEAHAAQAAFRPVPPPAALLACLLGAERRHLEERSAREMGAAVRPAEGLAHPRFKGRIETILPEGANTDHWKQALVYQVKELMLSEQPAPLSPSLQGPKAGRVEATLSNGGARSPRAEGRAGGASAERPAPSSGSSLLGQSAKSLLERLESVGLLASAWSDASLSMESHLASFIIKKHLCENETVGAQGDPLAYWKKRRDIWPALVRLATTYLSCPSADKRLLGTCCPSSEGVGDVSNPGPGRVEGATRGVSSPLTASGTYIAAA
ncbi:putative protein ZBED10P [Capricornis sumatraensis]|uniref:putative protein ZBED10P n=1 Tax=Capricornis sumatraensis TaxID=34865 RepID=UPI0036043FE6